MSLTRRQALASGAAVLATTIAKPAIAAKDPIPVGYLPALTGPFFHTGLKPGQAYRLMPDAD